MPQTHSRDLYFLKETLRLAKKGAGWTNPNPMVGCVIVKDDKIISKGYHRKSGGAHAEIDALDNCEANIKDATLYVNLEPCSHYGKTPPCVNAIIKAGIARVVCPFIDPNPTVYGNGIRILQEAGVQVTTGLLEEEARKINEVYFGFHIKKRPFIVLKFAASLDGKIATRLGDSKWITNEKARRYARILRSNYQAILIGVNTVITDNPHLDVGIKGKKDPLRIILDSGLRIPLYSNVLRDNNVLIVTTKKADAGKKQKLMEKNVPMIVFDSEKISLRKLLDELVKREIISVFVEGGSQMLGSFLDEKLVDKVYAFTASILIGGSDAIGAISGKGAGNIFEAIRLKDVTRKFFGDDMLTTGYVG